MTSIHAIEWLDTIINVPQVCGGNLEDNNKALNRIKQDIAILEILSKNIDVDLLKANEKAPIVITILRCKPLTNTIDKEYQKVKEWLKQ